VRLTEEETLPLPLSARDWDLVGVYQLQKDGRIVDVRLYNVDSDNICEKRAARGEPRHVMSYPNSFTLVALFREADNPWERIDLYSVGRVGFDRVQKVSPEAVNIRLRSKKIVFFALDGSAQLPSVKSQLANYPKPWTRTLILRDGRPVLVESVGKEWSGFVLLGLALRVVGWEKLSEECKGRLECLLNVELFRDSWRRLSQWSRIGAQDMLLRGSVRSLARPPR
jgi:hypothetical protein